MKIILVDDNGNILPMNLDEFLDSFISKYYESSGQPNDDQNYSRGFGYTSNKDTESYTYIAYE